MPIVYSRPGIPSVSIIYPAAGFDGWKDVPVDAINPRYISIEDIENSLPEFRVGWQDVLPGPQLDVCHKTVKDHLLKDMKERQGEALEHLGRAAMDALLQNDQERFQRLQNRFKEIKEAHKPLEDFEVSGHNQLEILVKLRSLAQLPIIEG